MSKFEFDCVLYKNMSEPIGQILPNWIKNDTVTLKYKDISQFDLNIPYKINGKVNKIYNLIKSRMQIIMKYNGESYRFIVCNKVGNKTLGQSYKEFTCYSFEETLKKKRIKITAGNYQLKQGIDPAYTNKGLLDMIEDNCGWKIGYVEPKACYNNEETQVWEEKNYQGLSIDKLKFNNTIFELKKLNIDGGKNSYNNNPLFLNIQFKNVVADSISCGNVYNDFSDLPFTQPITGIKAKYVNEAGNRNGIKYYFTLKDGSIKTSSKAFVPTNDNGFVCDGIRIAWTNGETKVQDVVRYPYIEEIDNNIYEVLKNWEDLFNCTFIFDTINKKINCYYNLTYGDLSKVELSLDTNIISIKDTESTDIPNCIKVIGQDNLSIASENIFGGDKIYNYKYYLDTILSKPCSDAWRKYTQILEDKQDEWKTLKDKRKEVSSAIISCDSEINSLTSQWSVDNELLSTYIAQKLSNDQTRIAKEMKKIETNLNANIKLRDELNLEKTEISYKLQQFADQCNRNTAKDENGNLIFTEEMLSELDDIEEVVVLNDTNHNAPYSLWKYAKEYLEDLIDKSIEFEINSTNMSKFENRNKHRVIKEGNLYYLDKDMADYLKVEKVRLLEMQFNTVSGTITKLTFSTKEEKNNKLDGLTNMSRTNSKATKTLNSYNEVLYNSQFTNNYVDKLMNEGLNLATNIARGNGTSNSISIGSGGILIKDCEEEDRQLFISSSCICLSTDGFKTSKVAICPEYILADMLAGKLLLGKDLKIEGEDGLFEVGDYDRTSTLKDFGIKISDKNNNTTTERILIGLEAQPNSSYKKAVFRLYGDQGNVCISESGIMRTNSFAGFDYLDHDTPMEINFYLGKEVNVIKEFRLLLKKDRLKSTVKSVASGGVKGLAINVSGTGGIKTSSSAGAYSNTVSTTSEACEFVRVVTSIEHQENHTPNHYHEVETKNLKHSHSIKVPISIPSHSHTVSIPNLSGSGTIDTRHNHELQYGIYEAPTIARALGVDVNNTTLKENITTQYYEIAIPSKLLNIGSWNTIKVRASDIAKVSYSIYIRYFGDWE